MNIVDGRHIRRTTRFTCDIAIVGSGPAGATAAVMLSEAGLDVMVVEAGRFFSPSEDPTRVGEVYEELRVRGHGRHWSGTGVAQRIDALANLESADPSVIGM